ncbi:unnamed protein product, partial [Brassica oleracea]
EIKEVKTPKKIIKQILKWQERFASLPYAPYRSRHTRLTLAIFPTMNTVACSLRPSTIYPTCRNYRPRQCPHHPSTTYQLR